jgi:hypothetical protein
MEDDMISGIKGKKSRKRKYYRLISHHVEPNLDARICSAADHAGITVSDFIRNACVEALAEAEAIDDPASIDYNSAE